MSRIVKVGDYPNFTVNSSVSDVIDRVEIMKTKETKEGYLCLEWQNGFFHGEPERFVFTVSYMERTTCIHDEATSDMKCYNVCVSEHFFDLNKAMLAFLTRAATHERFYTASGVPVADLRAPRDTTHYRDYRE